MGFRSRVGASLDVQAMKDLSVRIRRAAARWLFVDRDLRMHYVAEEYGFEGRTADVIGYSREREERRGIYRKVDHPWEFDGRRGVTTRSERVGERVKQIPPEVRIVEVKISRSDLAAGIRKGQIANDGAGFGAFADFCYLAGPHGLITARDLPAGWGLLEFRERQVWSSKLERGVITGVVVLAQKPTRLTPTKPLTEDVGDLAHRIAQSALWRLYGHGRAAPEELGLCQWVRELVDVREVNAVERAGAV